MEPLPARTRRFAGLFAGLLRARVAKDVIAPAVALLGGGFLYLGRGPTRGEAWLGLEASFDRVRTVASPVVRSFPSWVQDAGPDAAWSFALGSVLASLTGSRNASPAWRAAGLALAIGYEAGQGLGFVRGTFDPKDLAAIVLGYALAMVAHPSSANDARALASEEGKGT